MGQYLITESFKMPKDLIGKSHKMLLHDFKHGVYLLL